jgi:hypothetical protein
MYRYDNTINLKRPSTFSPLTQASNKELSICIYKVCTIPKTQALGSSEDSQDHSFNVVPRLLPSLSNSSAATANI